ncbi:dienelactone hydrolase family protein [Methanosarcina sp.]|uniref:dienelactone hydrolase family protein n=1 Tax=Methanosarcina sp. TaxID=2213 RepID=UPI002988A492|nr:dienelactone hydrolase family protein [Methanosarcina sp.]MDW5549514.1 dienelactone hydrolase family protein [Methanosarcina sp.]MDW5553548.1 dienelactone hydrolase family protein [Methanosarcina sp.]MDW5558648.1 dienelactone hydrolase family protein [Methanosarcina sp.]
MRELSSKGKSSNEVKIPINSIMLEGNLTIPEGAKGIVVFAHGSGSSRFSYRNRYVAQELQKEGLGTLLFDLLTAEEERIDMITAHLRFDIDLLANRLVSVTNWLFSDPETKNLNIGYFGASTGAAAALIAAKEHANVIKAVVSRGGRPDLAEKALPNVKAPTLLIVGGEDYQVIEMNEWALDRLKVEQKELKIVPGATHLFEEPGTLEQVANLAGEWFKKYLLEKE